VDACPVDCIHPKKDTVYEDGRPGFNEVEQLYIDPVECIDCGACVPAWQTEQVPKGPVNSTV
jgi:NAD-dependent dihydropyrimidine dehydrogenase PreA subunit